MMRFLLLITCVSAAACGDKEEAAAATRDAVWEIHEDENLAVPVCAACGEVLDRSGTACAQCETPFRIVAKTIDCPECAGDKACIHCGDGAACLACDGTHQCAPCDGSGLLDGAACPECAGAKKCTACESGTCDRCAGGRCANCDGTGSITLR